jgi:hypothetical protein
MAFADNTEPWAKNFCVDFADDNEALEPAHSRVLRRVRLGPRVPPKRSAYAIVGREAELEAVERFLDGVPSGPLALVVEGEAGIGKTTLWLEAVRAAEDRAYRVLQIRPAQSEAELSYVARRPSRRTSRASTGSSASGRAPSSARAWLTAWAQPRQNIGKGPIRRR